MLLFWIRKIKEGYDYGKYTLANPKQLAVSMRNNIYVLDEESIFIYDNYGTALENIDTPDGIRSIRIIFQWLSINSGTKVYLKNLNSKADKLIEVALRGYENDFEIVSSMFFNSSLYVLTNKNILIYSSYK